MKYNFDRKATSSAYLEDCILSDMGIKSDKDFVDIKSAENTVRNNFKDLNVIFCETHDGYQIRDNINDCIVYACTDNNQVMSYDFNKVATNQVEMWHFVNECLIKYFFNN